MAELSRLPDAAMAALRMRDGAGLPPIGRSALRGVDRIVAIGPDEWLAIAPDGDAEGLTARLADAGDAIIDVSGNRIIYRAAVAGAHELLAAGCALDLEALAPGDAISTLLARAQVILIAEEDGSVLILLRRSFSGYLEAWTRAALG